MQKYGYVLVYTRKGEEIYNSGHADNYPGLTAQNCDVQDAMHLAVSWDKKTYVPMRNNTGILFPRADFEDGRPGGRTKTLRDPWVFRLADGSFGICAVRYGQNEPDPSSTGSVMLFTSEDLIRYEEAGFLELAKTQIRHPRCRWEEDRNAYYMEWETDEGRFGGYTRYFREIGERRACAVSAFSPDEICGDCGSGTDEGFGGIPDAVPGNVLRVSEEEARRIENYLGVIRNTGIHVREVSTEAGQKPAFEKLPGAVCEYSDGSVHEKKVCWDREAYDRIDFAQPGVYRIKGQVMRKRYPFPFVEGHMSDPCICVWDGRYFLSASGMRSVTFRVSDTLEGLTGAEPFEIYRIPEEDEVHTNMWAPEMHVIHGVPYVFTTVGEESWTTVRSHVLRCNGDPADPSAWEAPRLVLKPDGSELRQGGISLDMTYFCVDGVHYVMWSDRCFADRAPEHTVADSADIFIAVIDPDHPWQLVTDPVRILRPVYGWDRYETEVDEGPYLLRRGDDLFVTISGSSTGLGDLYCIGLLHAKRGNNLLSPEGWDWLPYPVLTKESVPGEFGPGHNCFIKDPDTGDDLMVYHAIPHDAEGRALGRRMAVRRVHWAANGYPYLEMTPERDLAACCEQAEVCIRVEGH